jgi:hypothetical protein
VKIQGEFTDGDYGQVFLDDVPLPLRPSLKVRRHSPTGFAWGYEGSGPAQLALAILLESGCGTATAELLYQDFKRKFIARFPQGAFVTHIDVDQWVKEELERRGYE